MIDYISKVNFIGSCHLAIFAYIVGKHCGFYDTDLLALASASFGTLFCIMSVLRRD